MIGEWKRNCPKCNKEITYQDKYKLKYANRDNRKCLRCALLEKTYKINTSYHKKCPKCKNVVFYSSKYALRNSIQIDSLCRKCSKTGELSPVLGTKQSEEVKRRKNEKLRNKKRSLESKKKYSISKMGNKNPMYGNHTSKSSSHRRKIRIGCVKNLKQKSELVGKTILPRINPIACQKIDDYGNKNGYNFRHGLNSDEFYIEKLGYWVDGYDQDKNVVIEYYEKFHNRTKNKKKDLRRQKEIIDFLGCSFIIIHENGEIIVH
jgi:hypothetical protein